MTLLNRRPREVYRVYDEDELANESAWLGAEQDPSDPLEDSVPLLQEQTSPRPAQSVAPGPRARLMAILLGGALAGLFFGLLIVHGQHPSSGGSPLPAQARSAASPGAVARNELGARVGGPQASRPSSTVPREDLRARPGRIGRRASSSSSQTRRGQGQVAELHLAGGHAPVESLLPQGPRAQPRSPGAYVEFDFER